MTREEWSNLKPGMKIRAKGSIRVAEIIGPVSGQEHSNYPDFRYFSPKVPIGKAMICENWEIVK